MKTHQKHAAQTHKKCIKSTPTSVNLPLESSGQSEGRVVLDVIPDLNTLTHLNQTPANAL